MSTQSFDPEFDAFATDYDAALQKGLDVSGENKNYFARGRLTHLSKTFAQISFTPTAIMDFGCGTGSATPFVREFFLHHTQLLGVDVSEKSLEVARRNHGSANTTFQLMSAHQPKDEFDLVFCNGVFHHIPVAERDSCVRYIFDSLRPGGYFALFENNPWNPGTRLVMSRIPFDKDAIRLSPPESRHLVRRNGLGVVQSNFLFYFPRNLRWFRPTEPMLRKIPLGAQYLILSRKPA